MSEKNYIALMSFRHKGQTVQEGAVLKMSEKAAKYMVLNGQVEEEKDKTKVNKTPAKKVTA